MLSTIWIKIIGLFSFFLFALVFPLFSADSFKASEMVKRSDELMRGDTNQGIYAMEVVTPNWQRKLKLDVYSLGRDNVFIRILAPPKEAGIGTLRIKNEMWNYLPNVEKTIKIPPSMMAQSWMGSDFANDDLVKESSIVNDYKHTIIAEEVSGGFPAYKIELIPKIGAAVIWGKIILWLRKGDCLPLKEEYYSEKGKLIKVLEYSDIGQVSERIIPRVWKMSSFIKPGQYTIIKLIDVEYNQPLSKDVFTLENLKKIQ